MTIQEKILTLTRQLYPRGRAFWMPKGGFFEKMHEGLSLSEARAYQDALSVLDSAIPDNDNFTAEDATQWERRLGLITNPAVLLSNRKLAITQKMAHPGDIYGRQHYLFLERELRSAGFNVYVHENIFDDGMGGFEARTPEEVTGDTFLTSEHGVIEHGDPEHDAVIYPIIANNLDSDLDSTFEFGNLRATFFIGGETVGVYADVDSNRQVEFRQIILRVKPTHMVGFLLINYI
jgi:hypothetical protein